MIKLLWLLLLFFPQGSETVDPDTVGEKTKISTVLDDFHDAAAKADGKRYFAHFAPEGVFMGTDPGERWTLPAFRKYAQLWFDQGKGWAFVPHNRHISLAPGDKVAWFDEALDSVHYGRCRGSGVLRKAADKWLITQYNLSIPVPNALTKNLVHRIRGKQVAETVIFIVRHAEKGNTGPRRDPNLSNAGTARAKHLARMLKHLQINAAYTTPYQRTRQTVIPTAMVAGIKPIEIPVPKLSGLAKILKTNHHGQHVLVAGHSNTVPALLADLGIKKKFQTLGHDDYSNLFIVTLRKAEAPTLLHLQFGE